MDRVVYEVLYVNCFSIEGRYGLFSDEETAQAMVDTLNEEKGHEIDDYGLMKGAYIDIREVI